MRRRAIAWAWLPAALASVSACSGSDAEPVSEDAPEARAHVARIEELPDRALVEAAYRTGLGARAENPGVRIESRTLSRLASGASLPRDDVRAFIESGEADALLVTLYRRFGLEQGTPGAENALLFVVAWQAYHGREATPAQVQGVLAQIGAAQQQAVDSESAAQKRVYALLAAVIHHAEVHVFDSASPAHARAFRERLREDLQAWSGNDLAGFQLTSDGFVSAGSGR
ncbi:hypothetical protein [Luteimonas deserti]|uniref:Uncharacterized protein n=1 Tax=Luteimonas deserti TaxID=2752306 RepID=A0A7Z0QNY3_9GAMM|nr:hypothetical protein [Luteimonas deserti]NYZ62111.1 hypothetical protein [Luteimonas deserti]